MSRQLTFSDVAAQRTLSEMTVTTAVGDDTAPTTRAGLLDRARQHAATVAADHFPALPVERIDWEISERTQRTAGVTTYDPQTDEITISLTWDAYDSQGWEQFSETVRHELIHAWQYHEPGEADHGRTFVRWTDVLDTSQHCERFTAPKWWLVCEDCGGRTARYRRSKTVRNPEQYRCSKCGGSIRVKEGGGH
ncbi:SprT family zinc-dependent metalloprotease [Haladaptatus halobius]|uniref:SprT family zinc-dependent metalloprotease n=1 Tax=Haladaptatus halobius TaxID=2884875 RepID=UPI001D0A87F7|nr:SprT-like domain-containing protein [Haladaptatus halobius]